MEASPISSSASYIDSARRPAFTFLFKTRIDKMCLCFKKVLKNVLLTSLFSGGKRDGEEVDGLETERVDHNVVDFNIGCRITNAYNKQNIYSVLKFNVQREFECSFLISVVGESVYRISGQSRSIDTDLHI